MRGKIEYPIDRRIDSPSIDNSTVQACIIGAGPAGSVAASWLARNGISTLVVEKHRFPRFRIGESLLPNGNRILKKIGVWERIQSAGFVEKRGAQFTLPDRSRTVRNIFAEGIIPDMEMTYQVERARFDEILLDHSKDSGAIVWEDAKVVSAEQIEGRWRLSVSRGEENTTVSANWIIDASGRNSVMGPILGLKRTPLPYPARFAVFNHFTNVARDQDEKAGDIIVLRLKDAWFWLIPISESLTSVGVVLKKNGGRLASEANDSLFWRKVGESSFLSAALASAIPQGDFRVDSDYSFSRETFGDRNTLLAGDAASFIDPVFSSGVYLGLESGLLAAEMLVSHFEKGEPAVSRTLYDAYTRTMKKRIGRMRQLVEVFYDDTGFEVFMAPQPGLRIPNAVNSILAGCLLPTPPVRWRFWLFRLICAIHKRLRLAPPILWESVSKRPNCESAIAERIGL